MRLMHRSDTVRRTSDAEITRPHNDLPSEPPPLPAWHVHLELQPEELITLHRLGFTGGALAWREGMPEWQPLRVGEAGIRDARESTQPPATEDSLSQPIPLTRRSNSRGNSGSVVALDRPRPFRHSTPPIGLAVAHMSERARPELMLPPPPVFEARGNLVELARSNDRAPLAVVEPWAKPDSARSAISAVREQQPPSIPPLALDARSKSPRARGSRALWLGAAALVALSASNGALVSALLWSLRHDAARPAGSAAAARMASAARPTASGPAADAKCPAPVAASTSAATASNPFGNGGPVSVEQLPLAGEKTATVASSGSAARGSSSRKGAAQKVTAEEAGATRKAEATASATPNTPGPLDRRALAQAVARAASAASSCAQGPEKGRVALTFAPSGSVQSAQLEEPFDEPGLNSCVLRAMGRARIRPFVGETVTVHKTVSW
jgi:hypothetical protein